MSALADLHARYLAERQHVLSTGGLKFADAVHGQAAYIAGEAKEVRDAAEPIKECCADPDSLCVGVLEHLRHEIADVVLATVTLANILGVSVEDCIAEKTAKDRGRG